MAFTPEQVAFISKIKNEFSLRRLTSIDAALADQLGLPELKQMILRQEAGLIDNRALYQYIYEQYHNAVSTGMAPAPVEPETGMLPPPGEGDLPGAEVPGAGDGTLNAGGGLDWATLNLQSIIAAQQAELARQQMGQGFLEQIMDTQRDPFSIVPALQLYGGAGGGTLAPHAALAEGGGAIQQSPYGDVAQRLIDSLARFTSGVGVATPEQLINQQHFTSQDAYEAYHNRVSPPSALVEAPVPQYIQDLRAGIYHGQPVQPPPPELVPPPEFLPDQQVLGEGGEVVSDEPMLGVGAYSGLLKFLLGEKGPEKLKVTPMGHGGRVSVKGQGPVVAPKLPTPSPTIARQSMAPPSLSASPQPMAVSGGSAPFDTMSSRYRQPEGAPSFTGLASTKQPYGAPSFGGRLPQVAPRGRSLAQVFAQAGQDGRSGPSFEARAAQIQRQRVQEQRAQGEASERVRTILDALQSYTSSPQATKRRKRGIETISGY
mgnify:CR=1 FL=1